MIQAEKELRRKENLKNARIRREKYEQKLKQQTMEQNQLDVIIYLGKKKKKQTELKHPKQEVYRYTLVKHNEDIYVLYKYMDYTVCV